MPVLETTNAYSVLSVMKARKDLGLYGLIWILNQ